MGQSRVACRCQERPACDDHGHIINDGQAAICQDHAHLTVGMAVAIQASRDWAIESVAPYVGTPTHFIWTFRHRRLHRTTTLYGTLVDVDRRIRQGELDKAVVAWNLGSADADQHDRTAGRVIPPEFAAAVEAQADATNPRHGHHALQEQIDVIARGHADLRRDILMVLEPLNEAVSRWLRDGLEPSNEESWTQYLELARGFLDGSRSVTNLVPDNDGSWSPAQRWLAIEQADTARAHAHAQVAQAMIAAEGIRLHRQNVQAQQRGLDQSQAMIDIARGEGQGG